MRDEQGPRSARLCIMWSGQTNGKRGSAAAAPPRVAAVLPGRCHVTGICRPLFRGCQPGYSRDPCPAIPGIPARPFQGFSAWPSRPGHSRGSPPRHSRRRSLVLLGPHPARTARGPRWTPRSQSDPLSSPPPEQVFPGSLGCLVPQSHRFPAQARTQPGLVAPRAGNPLALSPFLPVSSPATLALPALGPPCLCPCPDTAQPLSTGRGEAASSSARFLDCFLRKPVPVFDLLLYSPKEGEIPSS